MSSYKHPFIAQTEPISFPDVNYHEPALPEDYFDETLFIPAEYGTDMKKKNFVLEDNIHFLNHGSFGATPRVIINSLRVLAAVQSVDWKAGDSILYLDIGYGPIIKFIRTYSKKMGFKLIEVRVPIPIDMNALVASVESHLHAEGTTTRLAIVDHITSGTGLILPVKELINVCHNKGVPVCVDGAHGIGQVELNMVELGADYYVSNLHKWLFASKGCAFMYIDPKHWKTIHPTLATEGDGLGVHSEFSWSGTKDYTPWLSTFASLEFYQRAGGAKIREHNHDLAVWAGKMLMNSWQTNFAVQSDDFSEHVGCLVSIRVPTNKTFDTPIEAVAHAEWLHDTLWNKYRIEVPVSSLGGRIYLRISGQIYNTQQDYIALRDAVNELYNRK